MMAEMPPNSKGPAISTTTTMTPVRQGISFDLGFLVSIPGILTIVAWVFSFGAFIAYEVFKSALTVSMMIDGLIFHEFCTVTSWVFLTIFLVVAALRVYSMLRLSGSIFKFVMIGHSAIWALFLLISSAIALSNSSAGTGDLTPAQQVVNTLMGYNFPALTASGALGLLASFALMGTTVVLILDLVGVKKQNIFE